MGRKLALQHTVDDLVQETYLKICAVHSADCLLDFATAGIPFLVIAYIKTIAGSMSL